MAELVPYEDDIFGFSVEYPGTWATQEVDPSLGTPLFIAQGELGLPRVLVDLGYADTLGDVREMAAQVLDSLTSAIEGVKVLSEGPLQLADGTAAYEYGLEIPLGTTTLGGRLVVVPRGSQLWQVYALTVRGDYQGRLPELDRITRSFRLLEPTPFGVPRGQALTLFQPEPQTLDPHLIGDVGSYFYAVQIFGGLVALDRDLQVIPDLAERWDVQEGGTVYVFHLRRDVKFHSGKALTAQDVKYSLERAADPATGSRVAAVYLDDIVGVTERLAGATNQIAGVEVIEEFTVRIRIDKPVPYFLAKLTHPASFIVNRQNVEAGGPGWFGTPDGTGPFKLKGWRQRTIIVLERYEQYHRGQAQVPYIFVSNLLLGDPLLMYETGELDVAYIGGTDVVKARDPSSTLGEQLQVTPELALFFVGFNTREAPFDDPRARRAFALALDRDALIALELSDTVEKAAGFLPLVGLPGHNPDLAPIPFDPASAKALWQTVTAETGVNPEAVTLLLLGALPTSVYLAMAAMWESNLGIEVAFAFPSSDDFGRELEQSNAHLFDFGWVADYPDPQNFLDVLFHGQAINNYGVYRNPQADALLEKARVEQDSSARLQLYRDAEELMLEDAAAIPLWYNRNYVLVKPFVKDWFLSGLGIPDLFRVRLDRPVSV